MVGCIKRMSAIISLTAVLILTMIPACLSFKTVPVNRLAEMQVKIIRVHSGDSLWISDDYKISENILTGKVIDGSVKVSFKEIADIYAAPADAVKIEGGYMTLPVNNIGKADHSRRDPGRMMTLASLLFFIIVLPTGMSFL